MLTAHSEAPDSHTEAGRGSERDCPERPSELSNVKVELVGSQASRFERHSFGT